MNMKRALCLGWVLVAAAAFAATEETLQKTFNVGTGGKLVIDVNGGSVEVKATDRKNVHIDVYRKATSRGFFGGSEQKERAELEANKVTFAQEGDQVIVKARRDKDAPRNSNVNLNSRFTVLVPREFNADLRTAGGSIRVDDLKGTLKAHTSGGSLKFAQIKGPIDGHTSGGSIDLTGSEGNVIVKTSGGPIKVREHKGDLQARTSGGSIDVDRIEGNVQASSSGGSVTAVLAKQPTGDCRLETSGGGVSLRLPETASVNLDAKTSGGSVQSDLPVKMVGEKKRNSLKGTINEGGKTVYLRTSGGSIQVKKI
jgi:DUF4097 and DUF4098 domain-containing protein YvlB